MLKFDKATWQNASSILEPQINAEGVHSWPFDPAFPIDIRFLVFGHQHDIRMNRHDYFELLYGYSGETTFQVQGRSITIKKGDLFIMGSTLFHRPVQSGFPKMKAVVVYFSPELIHSKRINEEAAEYLMPFLVQDSLFPHLVPAETGVPSQVLRWIKQIHKELPATSIEARLSVKTYLEMILLMLVKHYRAYRGSKEVFARKERDIKRLRPLFEFMNQHYTERISLEQANSIVGMSKSHFIRFFRGVTGQPFVGYLNHFRVAKAQELLSSTDKSIAEVSQEVGFCDQSYFGILFRRFVHMSPLQYRYQSQPRVQKKETT